MNGQLVDVTTFSHNFPDKILYEIQRNNLLDGLEEKLSNNDIVFVRGNSGMGKTVLLKQFCQKFNAISIFISPAKSNLMSIELALDSLIRQMEFISKNEAQVDTIDSFQKMKIKFQTSLLTLNQYAATKGPVYIVLDGLYHSIIDAENFIEELLEYIPVGKKNIKVLVSNTEEKNILDDWIFNNKVTQKDFSVVGFTEKDVGSIFSEYELSELEIEDIRATFKGRPLDIVELKYVIENIEKENRDVQNIIDNVKGGIFDYLWEKAQLSPIDKKILASIIFSSKELDFDSLSVLVEISREKLEERVKQISFLEKCDNKVMIRNENYINSIENKLDDLKKQTYDKLAKYVLLKKDTDDYWLLAQYYEEAENYEGLFNILDDNDFVTSIIRSNSLSSLKMLVSSGLKASRKIDNNQNIFKYSFANTVVRSNGNSDKNVEIEALMRIKQEDKALSIARSSTILEDKIHCLAIIAKKQKEERGAPDSHLISEIKELYENLNHSYIGEKGIAIASDLISVDIELAIELLEKSFNLEKEENSLDKIMMALSLNAIQSSDKNEDKELVESIKQKMKSPELKDAFSTMFNFNKSIPPKYLLNEIKKIESFDARVTFLANWCEENDAVEYRLEILKYAFEQLGSNNHYKSNLGIYFKLSKQLEYENVDDYSELISLFDSRNDVMKENGSSVLYVRIILNIISLLEKFEVETAIERLDRLYSDVEKIDDVSTKLECRSYILVACKQHLNNEIFESVLGIVDMLQEELETELREITSNFAYQEEILSKPLEIIAVSDFDFCCDIIKSVNTIINREKLYRSLIKGLINQGILHSTNDEELEGIVEKILNTLAKISYDLDYYDDSLDDMLQALNYLLLVKNKQVNLSQKTHFRLLDFIKNIREASQKARAYALILNIFRLVPFADVNSIQTMLVETWQNINILPRKSLAGYEIVKILAESNDDFAVELSAKILEEKRTKNHFESDEFWTVVLSLRILILSFEGIDPNDTAKINQCIEKISNLIDTLESSGERAILYAQLLTSLDRKGINVSTKKIISKITKEIDEISSQDNRYKSNALRKSAAALYIHSRSYFENNLKVMSRHEKDECFYEICIYFMTKTTPLEPFYFGPSAKYNCSYEDALEILSLIKEIGQDSTKYIVLKLLLEIIREKKGIALNSERKNDLNNKIDETIGSVFGSSDFIQHEGFKILSEYYSWLTFKSYSRPKTELFLNRIKEIPNMSDRVFCMTTIASELRAKDSSFRDEILDSAEGMIDKLSSTSEKILRLEDMANAVHMKRDSKEKYYIKKALGLIDCSNDENEKSEKSEKRLINLAHQLDPEFASSLVSSVSEEEGSDETKTKRIKKQLSYLELSNKVTNDKGHEDFRGLSYEQVKRLSNVCWKSYGEQLSRSVMARKPEYLVNYLRIASRLSIDDSYPIYSWFIENANQKSRSNQSTYFDAGYIACRFALLNKQLIGVSAEEIDDYYSQQLENISITEGMLEQAINFIAIKLKRGTPNRITICDPYFDKTDLSFIYSLYEEFDIDDLEFFILTSNKQLKNNSITDNYKTEFMDYWKEKISLGNPPYMNFFVANVDSTNDSPFHDRYILSESFGLSLGGSINGLGGKKEININSISEEVRLGREEYYSHYFNNDFRYFRKNNLDVSIQTFSL